MTLAAYGPAATSAAGRSTRIRSTTNACLPPAYDGQEGDALALPEPRRQCTPRCLPYFSTANASRSTRGRPEVPTTTSLTVRVPEVDQVFCHASARYFVVVAYRSTVATYVPLT